MLVNYKGIDYHVTNPGEIMFNEKGYLINQLDTSLPSFGRYWSKKLTELYNLSELDYYIIVVLMGDETKIPRCQWDDCNEPCEFVGLTYKKQKYNDFFKRGCCKSHTLKVRSRELLNNRYKSGWLPPPSFEEYWTPERKDKVSKGVRRSVKEGTHPWLLKNSAEKRQKLIAEGKNKMVNMARLRSAARKGEFLDIFDPEKMKDIEYVLYSERESFKYRLDGTPEDECYFYLAYLDGDRFKIGVTKNCEKRFRQYYHGLQYKEPKILYTAKRFEIAEIEYKVKKQFLGKVVLGTETYSINDLEEIMEYINSLINNPCN